MNMLKNIKKIHKWIALFAGIQLLLWMISGLIFSLLPQDDVSGSKLLQRAAKVDWTKGEIDPQNFVEINRRYKHLVSISTAQFNQSLVYLAEDQNGQFILDPKDLEKIEITNLLARELAKKFYRGEGDLINATLINQKTLETRKFKLPLWKLDFSDNENSSLYMSALTGRIYGVKTDSWRLFDFFWMLHIMDYSEHDDFNNSLVIFAALLICLVGLSGLWLLLSVFSFSDFNFLAKYNRIPLLIRSRQGVSTEIFVTKNSRLIDALANSGYQLPSNCGGGGSCGLCLVKLDPSIPLSKADLEHLTEQQKNAGYRLACQQTLSQGLTVGLPPQVVEQQYLNCSVVSNEFKTPLIKELVLGLPEEENFHFNAGEYVLLHIPTGISKLEQVALNDKVKPFWQKAAIGQFSSLRTEPINRAYSMANPPCENTQIELNIRLALPVDGKGESGKASSYLFNLTPGQLVNVSGPFGHFHSSEENNDMVFIGGGAGMAPLRSHIKHQLETVGNQQSIVFWFGARNQDEIFYQAEFDQLQEKYNNFKWCVALSDENLDSSWRGHRGMIHQVFESQYLQKWDNSKTTDFYICGPALMNTATKTLLLSYGVNHKNIHVDNFGF